MSSWNVPEGVGSGFHGEWVWWWLCDLARLGGPAGDMPEVVSRRVVIIDNHWDRASVVANSGGDVDMIVVAVGGSVGTSHGPEVTLGERSDLS